MTQLARAGCSVPQIAAFTGHSLRDAQTILDAHYLSRDDELAETAMAKLEGKEKGNANCKTRCKTRVTFSFVPVLSI